ncbi:DUF3977 family protein [Streptococcus canis]|uniref:DUF3977 family protein n=1 Tax=Streptococcus canis TaxID=1329 RepID=UPI00374EF19E
MEIGLGNSWLVRTEYEKDDGTETEVRGISGAIRPRSIYLRIWLGDAVGLWMSKKVSNSRPSLVKPSNVFLASYLLFS